VTEYTYLAADRATGRLLAELPLRSVQYDLRVNDAATLQCELILDEAPSAVDLTGSVRTSILVNRGDSLMFGGTIWGRQYTASTRTMRLDVGDTQSYLDAHVLITSDLNYKQVDQLAIARSLVQYANAKTGVALNPTYTGTTVSGVRRDRSYLGADGAPVGQRLKELSALEGGFDFRWVPYWDNGVGSVVRRALQLGYPTLGRTYPTSQLVFEMDVDTIDYGWTEDGQTVASTVYTTGAVKEGSPANAQPPRYTADDPTVRVAGYPRMEAAESFSDITTPSVLAAHARGKLALTRMPLQTFTLTIASIAASAAPQLGEYLPGDHCLTRIPRGDGLYRYGAEIVGLITAVSVAVDEEGNDTITVTIAPESIAQGVPR